MTTTSDAVLLQPASDRSQTSAQAWWLGFAALCVALALPLLFVDIPPLLDYPNHLARLFVLASLPQDPVLARFYTPHWSIIPNLALDLLGPPLIHWLPVYVAGRLLIAAALLLPVVGTVAYHAALRPVPSGRWWSLGVGSAAYNNCLLHGFLNFNISLGLALLLAAAWLRWREDRPVLSIAMAAGGTVPLFFCHLMGLVFFAVLVGAAELHRLLAVRGGALRRAVMRRGIVLLLVFATPVVLYALSNLQQIGGDAEFVGPGRKLFQLMAVFDNYNAVLDTAAFCLAIGLPVKSLVERSGKVPGPAAIAIVLLLVLYLAAPSAWKGTYALDIRFIVMLAFMLFAGFIPTHWSPVYRSTVAAGLIVVFLARMALLTAAWANHNADLTDLRRVLEPVQPGQAVYVAEASVQEAPAYWKTNPGWRLLSDGFRIDDHLGALVLLEHRAYWPFEFDIPSQQPIETREPYRSLALRLGHMPNRAEAGVADVCGFDYVLLQEADAVPGLPAERFRLVAKSGFAALYSIRTCEEKQ